MDNKINYETDVIDTNKLESINTIPEVIIPSNNKKEIEFAISRAVLNGEKLDAIQTNEIQISPNISFNSSPTGISLQIGLDIIKKTSKIYIMKS